MTTFRISKYIYLHRNTPTPQGLVSSGIDRDASEWTKYPNSPLQLIIDTTPSGGAKISLKYESTSLEYLDTDEINDKFGATYGKNNPPLIAICKQPGIGFKYLVRRFHTMTYRFQIKFASMDEYERAVEMLFKAGLSIKGKPPKSLPAQVPPAQDSFKNFNPESQWNGDDADGDVTRIDPELLVMSQPPFPPSQQTSTDTLHLSQTLVETPTSSQAQSSKYTHSARPSETSFQSYQSARLASSVYSQPTMPTSSSMRFSETSTWKRAAGDISSLETSPVNSPPSSPKRTRSWKQHFTPADTDIRKDSGMVSRGTQTENPEWLSDTRAMEQHIVDVVQNPLFDAYVARIKELMKNE